MKSFHVLLAVGLLALGGGLCVVAIREADRVLGR